MYRAFEKHLKEEFPELITDPFLLACSGGIDSVVLAHLCAELSLPFSLAHCNFQLRGEASNRDEEFVKNLADKLKVSYYAKRFETAEYVLLNKVSIQEGARMLRYRWFEEICAENGLKYLVTAHHADDALETFLFHLSRGAGLGGLTGIPQRNNSIRRPLLPFSKDEIRAFAKSRNLSWRTDKSNEDNTYFRNKIRHDLLPQFNELHPGFLENFRKSVSLLKGSHAMLQHFVADTFKNITKEEGDELRLPVEKIKKLHPVDAWCYEFFSPFGFTDWESIVNLLDAQSGKIVYSPSHELLKDRDYLILRPLQPAAQDRFDLPEEYDEVKIPICLKIKEVNSIGETSKNILYMDKETLNGRLHVRKWQKGDYFYPLGMKGRKLVSKFFKDLKLNQFEKEEQWLLCCGEEIAWIIGQRPDERFKVRDKTETVLKIEYHK